MENSTIEEYGREFVKEAKEGKIDPIIGRNEETKRLIQILLRRTKNNPVLIGEPGVGKTAVVEGLAQKIAKNDVPESLKNSKIFEINLTSLISGAKYRGEFEERLQKIINQAKEEKIILFIDEIHMMVGAGKSEGSSDISNILKPLLARGQIKLIGATTLAEYRESIEKDGALERRMQKIIVKEPSIENAITMLRGIKERLELYHGLKILDEAIIAAVKLSERYITDRYLPDKAIDLIDEASAALRAQIDSIPEELDNLTQQKIKLELDVRSIDDQTEKAEKLKELKLINEKQKQLELEWNNEKKRQKQIEETRKLLDQAKINLELAERNYDYEKMAILKNGEIPNLVKKLNELEDATEARLINAVIDENKILEIIAKTTNIPLTKLKTSDKQIILNIDKQLASKIIGQDEAIISVANVIKRSKANIQDPNRPIGSFIFAGPTGVGKTELAKQLTFELFGTTKNLIRLDMSEYMEKHSVSKILGAPPGYIGYDQAGQLTEKVRRNPYSVILCDEMEKAHSEVLNIMLQILDEGAITDSQGRKINFKNTIIIMTTNIGAQKIIDGQKFDLVSELKQFLKPELINRFDEIITFNKLNKVVIQKIIQKFLEDLKIRIESNDFKLNYDQKVIDFISENGIDFNYGARPLKRYIQKTVEVLIANIILEQNIKNIDLTVEENQIVVKKLKS